MLESHPPRSPGVAAGYFLVGALLVLDVIVGILLFTHPISLLSFFLGLLLLGLWPIMGIVLYLSRTLGRARYYVDDDALIIAWGGLTRQIPLPALRELFSGRDAGRLRRFRGARWPGLFLGRGELETDGGRLDTRFFAARGLAHQVVLVTDDGAYAVSPADPESFLACVRALRAVEGAAPPPVAAGPGPWEDQRARWLLLLPLPVNLALFAYLSAIYSRLPDLVPLRLDAVGAALQTGAPLSLFLLPGLALFGYLGNAWLGLYFSRARQEQNIATLLWAGGLGLQLAAWVGLMSLTAA